MKRTLTFMKNGLVVLSVFAMLSGCNPKPKNANDNVEPETVAEPTEVVEQPEDVNVTAVYEIPCDFFEVMAVMSDGAALIFRRDDGDDNVMVMGPMYEEYWDYVKNGIEGSDQIHFTFKDQLENVVIPATITFDGVTYSVSALSEESFADCKSLVSVTIPEGVYDIREAAFIGCDALVSVQIPESMMMIEERAFYNCASLPSLTIPGKVVYFGEGIFCGCDKLTTLVFKRADVEFNYDVVFASCDHLIPISVKYEE